MREIRQVTLSAVILRYRPERLKHVVSPGKST